MVILEKDNYRICTISRFTNKGLQNESISNGLAIEKRTEISSKVLDDPSYYVICFIKYNEHEECAEIEDVCMRILDIENNEWALFKDLLNTTKQIVEVANKPSILETANYDINCDGYYPYCTKCGKEVARNFVKDNGELPKYCPNCHAEMINYKEFIKERN